MLKRLSGALLAVLALTGPSAAWWGPDIYVERAAMAEAGRRICHIDSSELAERYKGSAEFFTGWSREAIERQVDRRTEALLARLVNASAVHTFCTRIRARDF